MIVTRFSPQLYGLQEVSSQLNPVTFLRLPSVFFFPDYLSPSTSSSQTIAVSCRFVGATKVGEKEATGGSVCQEDLGCAKVADDW